VRDRQFTTWRIPVRVLVALVFSALLGGCSFLDQIALNSQPSLDPNKIYLGTSRVVASWREVDRYACASGPMFCEQAGSNAECRCP